MNMRFEVVRTSDPANAYVATIDGKSCPYASVGISEMTIGMTEQAAANLIKVCVRAANTAGGIVETPDGPMLWLDVPGTKYARDFFRDLCVYNECVVSRIRQRGGYRVSSEGDPTWLSRLATASRKYQGGLIELGLRTDPNAFELDGTGTLTDAQRLLIKKKAKHGGRGDRDNGAFFRFGEREPILRTEAIFCRERIMKVITGKVPIFIELPVRFAANYGLRARREACGLTMWGIHKANGFSTPNCCFFNKGDGPEPTKRRALKLHDHRDLLIYIGGDRCARDPKGRNLEYFQELSRLAHMGDVRAKAELRATPVFLNSRGRALTYDNLVSTYVRPLLRAAQIVATLHWLRHEYVYDRLREIEAMPISQADRRGRKRRLARDMGWSGTAMFKIYDAYEEERRRLEDELEYQARREAGITAAQQIATGSDARPVVVPLPERASAPRLRFFGAAPTARVA